MGKRLFWTFFFTDGTPGTCGLPACPFNHSRYRRFAQSPFRLTFADQAAGSAQTQR
jgi:hypothetical protein